MASPYTVGWSIADEIRQYLMTLDPKDLAAHLIGGMTAAEADLDWGKYASVSLTAAALDDKETFVLPPLPNSLFSRDSSCWIFDGVSVNPMYWPARRREALNLFAIYRYHPMFAEADFNWWYPEQGEAGAL